MTARAASLRLLAACALLGGLVLPAVAGGADRPPETLFDRVRIEQRIGEELPLELPLRESDGGTASLEEILDGRPAFLVFAYYECPMLCEHVLSNLVVGLRGLPQNAGEDFEVVVVGIDPDEPSSLAAAKRETLMASYGRPGTEAGWHVLTGIRGSEATLAQAAGFGYERLDNGEYAHAAAVIVLDPEGSPSRYILGLDYPARDLRLALQEAREGTGGDIVSRALLLCYRYDPSQGRYTLTVMGLLRASAVLTVLAVGLVIGLLLRKERRKSSGEEAPE